MEKENKKSFKPVRGWYNINGKWTHYIDGYLNGKLLSMEERYKFESENFDLLFKNK